MERRRGKTQQLEYCTGAMIRTCLVGVVQMQTYNVALVPLQVELKVCKTKAIH